MSIRVQVSCIAVVKGKIVLIKRTNPNSGMYNQLFPPGGHVEMHETIEEACAREMLEETGLVVEDLRLVGVVSFIGHGTSYHSVCFFLKAGKVSGELSIQEPDKAWPYFIELKEVNGIQEIPDYHRAFIQHFIGSNKLLNASVEWDGSNGEVEWSIVEQETITK